MTTYPLPHRPSFQWLTTLRCLLAAWRRGEATEVESQQQTRLVCWLKG